RRGSPPDPGVGRKDRRARRPRRQSRFRRRRNGPAKRQRRAGREQSGEPRVTTTSDQTAPAMSLSEDAYAAAKPRWTAALGVYLRRRVLVVLLLGFSGGLPLALSGSTLLRWMAEAGVNLGTIGLFALVGTPYTIKFLWAPLVDAIDVPVLSRFLGRR